MMLRQRQRCMGLAVTESPQLGCLGCSVCRSECHRHARFSIPQLMGMVADSVSRSGGWYHQSTLLAGHAWRPCVSS